MSVIVEKRDHLLRPLARMATEAGIMANMVSGAGVAAMLLFVGFALQGWLALAVLPLAISIFFDFFDGTLARYQGKASEQGRKIDLAVDTTNFVIFSAGMALEKLWHPLSALAVSVVFVFAMWQGTQRARRAGNITEARGFWQVSTSTKYALYTLFSVQALTATWVFSMNSAAIIAAVLLVLYVVTRGIIQPRSNAF